MSTSLIIMSISGTLFLLFAVLTKIEEQRGRIALRAFRSWLDAVCLRAQYALTHVRVHVGSGAVRIFVHFCIHKVLGFFLIILTSIERGVARLQRQNRSVVRTIRQEQKKTHLDLIAEHKHVSALSEAEKDDLKHRTLER